MSKTTAGHHWINSVTICTKVMQIILETLTCNYSFSALLNEKGNV